MSFDREKDVVELGDTAMLYLGFDNIHALTVDLKKKNRRGEEEDHVVQTNYGALRVGDLVGKQFGSRVQLTRGYGFILHPTPELWTRTLRHRTQILYAADISLIVAQLELRPGSIVVESGTGSGSLSHSLVRAVMPSGHLHTFDFHEQRASMAREEFRLHKIDRFVTAGHRDVCADGFGPELDGRADAVFLDIPHPWDAIGHAARALNRSKESRLCSFSPCIEQVQRASAKMRELGFREITTLECLMREFQVRKITIPVFDRTRSHAEEVLVGEAPRKRKLSSAQDEDCKVDGSLGDGDRDEDPPVDNEVGGKSKGDQEGVVGHPPLEKTFATAIPLLSTPGHTGFLTFATLPPKKQDPPAEEGSKKSQQSPSPK